jgi:hypothetical protein
MKTGSAQAEQSNTGRRMRLPHPGPIAAVLAEEMFPRGDITVQRTPARPSSAPPPTAGVPSGATRRAKTVYPERPQAGFCLCQVSPTPTRDDKRRLNGL